MAHARKQHDREMVVAAAAMPSVKSAAVVEEFIRTGAFTPKKDVIPYDPETTPRLMDQIMSGNITPHIAQLLSG